MKHLFLFVFAALACCELSSGQRCQSDRHCSQDQCCFSVWFISTCRPRNWCVRGCYYNSHCQDTECCRRPLRGGTGQCESRPAGVRDLSTTCPTSCTSQRDCGSSECCRYTSSGQGQCVHNSQFGEACSSVNSMNIADTCPCDIGMDCISDPASSTPDTGVCKSHMSGCSSHSECQAVRKGTCCKSVGGSSRMCVTAVDAYGKC